MENTGLIKGDFVSNNHFDDIPQWTLQQCITFLGLSETSQAKLKGSKPTPAKIAVDKRLQELIDAGNRDVAHISADDHYLIVNIFNTTKFILESILSGKSSIPLISHGIFPTITDELVELHGQSLYLDEHLARQTEAQQESNNGVSQTTEPLPP